MISETEAKTLSESDVRTKVPWPFQPLADEGEYAKAIFRLQNEVGLEFREARAVLMPTEFTEDLAKEWGITFEELCVISRRGIEKVESFTGNDPAKNEEFMPTALSHIF